MQIAAPQTEQVVLVDSKEEQFEQLLQAWDSKLLYNVTKSLNRGMFYGDNSIEDLMQISRLAMWNAFEGWNGDLSSIKTYIWDCVNKALSTLQRDSFRFKRTGWTEQFGYPSKMSLDAMKSDSEHVSSSQEIELEISGKRVSQSSEELDSFKSKIKQLLNNEINYEIFLMKYCEEYRTDEIVVELEKLHGVKRSAQWVNASIRQIKPVIAKAACKSFKNFYRKPVAN